MADPFYKKFGYFQDNNDDDDDNVNRNGLSANALAITIADVLVDGKSRDEIEELSRFMTVLQAAIRNYLC